MARQQEKVYRAPPMDDDDLGYGEPVPEPALWKFISDMLMAATMCEESSHWMRRTKASGLT